MIQRAAPSETQVHVMRPGEALDVLGLQPSEA